MPMMNINGATLRTPVWLLVCSSIVWGCTWIPLKAFAGMPLEGAALMAVAYSAVALTGWLAGRRWWCVPGNDVRTLVAVALLGGYASIAFNLSVMYGEVVRMMSLFYTLPVWAVLGGIVFLGETLTLRRALAVLCALVGAWLILGGANILLAGLQAWPLDATPLQLGLGIAFGFGWLLLANIATQWSVTRLEAGRAAVIIILELVTAVVTSMWLLGTQLSLVEWSGALLILLAAWLEARGQV